MCETQVTQLKTTGHRLGAVACVQLLRDRSDMGQHRIHRHPKGRGQVIIRQTPSHQIKNLCLPLAQPRLHPSLVPSRSRKERVALSTPVNMKDRASKFLTSDGLEQKSGKHQMRCKPQVPFIRLLGKNDDSSTPILLYDAARRFQARHLRHGGIHQNHIWPQPLVKYHSLASIASVSDNADLFVLTKHRPQPQRTAGVIVNYQRTNWMRSGRHGDHAKCIL